MDNTTAPQTDLRIVKDDSIKQKPAPTVETPWLTLEQACSYLSVEPKTIYNWKNDGKVRAFNLHGSPKGALRFRKEDLDNVVTGEKKYETKTKTD